MRTIVYLIPIFFALFILTGCGDNNEEMLKYQQPFLGQWQEIARGNNMFPVLEPDGHVIEFLADGTIIYQNGWTRSYRIDAEFVYYDGGKAPSGHTYRYSFTGTDTLRLDYVDGAITDASDTPRFNIYKRIKTNEP